MADLITLDELLTARGETSGSSDDQYEWMITVASSIIRNFTGRDFGSAQVTETRTFNYDGSGYLDIDDASAITAVAFVIPNAADQTLDATYQWYAMPTRRDDAPVFWYMILPTSLGGPAMSPEMGFNRNLDVYYREHRHPVMPQMVKVTGTWGWPIVPPDVKQAAIWTIEEWLGREDGEALTQESIASYSRSWGRGGATAPAAALPDRARDILSNYEKLSV